MLGTAWLVPATSQAADPINLQTWPLDMMRAGKAYERGFTGSGVTVAVGDSGFDVNHVALASKFNMTLARNFLVLTGATYNPSELGVQTGLKFDTHGTHVAGIIAAAKGVAVGIDMHGVAYDAAVIPIRTVIANDVYNYGPGIDGDAAPLNYFASLRNVMIYNASYGPNRPENAPPQTVWTNAIPNSQAEVNAITSVLQAGKIIVAATGNDRRDDPIAGKNPSGLALYPYITPAHNKTGVYDSLGFNIDLTGFQRQNGLIIGVMSVGPTKEAAWYSQLCGVTASWCVAAPGGDNEKGGQVYSTIPYNDLGPSQGTSMAAPAASGALAVLLQANPTYNAQDLSRLLFSTTEDLGAPGIDKEFGHGLVRLDRATDGVTTLAANATKSVAANITEYWSRPLTTDGAFTKSGEGILTISGRTTAKGDVFAQLGTLAVDGTLSVQVGSKFNVAQSATLAGFGVVAGDSLIAGTLSPGKMANVADLAPGTVVQGNSVGSLTFNGNVTLASTANTRVDIDGTLIVPGGPGTYDKIYVTGAGNVFYAGGALTPVLRGSIGTVSNYTPAIGTQLAFVQAQNGASTAGGFSGLTQPTGGLPTNGRFDVIYSTTAITLAVTPASYSALASTNQLSESQKFFANLLDKARPQAGVLPTAAEKNLFDAIYKINTGAEFEKTVSQLGGPGQPAVAGASLQAFAGFLGAIGDRQDALAFGSEQGQNGTVQNFALSYAGRNMMTAETNSALNAFASITPAQRVQDGWTMWGQGFGRNSRVGDSGGLSGSQATSAGFTLGADRWFSNNLIAGGAFGYARTTASATDIQGNSDTYAGAAYASWTPGAAVVQLA